MIVFFISACHTVHSTHSETGFVEDSGIELMENCDPALTVSMDGDGIIDFGQAPALGNSITKFALIENTCDRDIIFMGNPSTWSDTDELILLSPPPLRLTPERAEIRRLYPKRPEHAGRVLLPTDLSGPIPIHWKATIGPAQPILLLSQNGQVARSDDGGESISTWTSLPEHDTNQAKGICYGNGRIIVVGGNEKQVIWSSTDGLNWNRDEQPGTPLNDCDYNGELFAGAAIDPHWSLAGLMWETGQGTPWMHDPLITMTSFKNQFVAIGGQGRIAVTQTGETWLFDESIGTFLLPSPKVLKE